MHKRRCLFNLGLFPQNFEIPVRRLVALWIAEVLVYPKDETETPDDVANKYLKVNWNVYDLSNKEEN